MNQRDAGPDNPADLAEIAPRPVDGHDDYYWCRYAVGSEVRQVYWTPQNDAIRLVGTVRPNPDAPTRTGIRHSWPSMLTANGSPPVPPCQNWRG